MNIEKNSSGGAESNDSNKSKKANEGKKTKYVALETFSCWCNKEVKGVKGLEFPQVETQFVKALLKSKKIKKMED